MTSVAFEAVDRNRICTKLRGKRFNAWRRCMDYAEEARVKGRIVA
jgi:hypothetical protein